MQFKNNRWWWTSLLSLSLFVSCKKEKDVAQTTTTTPTDTAVSAADRIKDTALLISRELYLWYDQIPSDFNPRTFAGPNEVMTEIRKYSKEPGFDKPVDRWSFAIEQAKWDNISSGIAGDFGLTVFFLQDGDLRVRTVEPQSPAGKAGIHRGWRVTKINGSDKINIANENAIINAVYRSNSTAFTFQKPDGTTTDVNLSMATYQEQPVALDSVYTIGGKKVGYLVYSSFLGDTAQVYNRFSEVFGRFASAQINDLVVDLRYNGGGYVAIQNKLAGYLLPQSANGDVLMSQVYNKNYTRFNSTVRVQKQGSLNLPRIFFIVSDNTASAAELIINNLKPYMEVKLIGPDDTYGKPVGYFPVPVSNWYVFPVSSRSTNKLGSGNYFNGFAVDSKVSDGLNKDWGDLDESCLKQAVRYITTGSFNGRIEGRGKEEFVEPSPQVKQANERFSSREFRGMIDSPHKQ